MRAHSAKHSTELNRNLRRNRRIRFWVGVICIGVFGVLTVMAYTKLDQSVDLEHEAAAAPPSEPVWVSKSAGRVVWIDSNGCIVSDFNNHSGQLGSQRSVSCSQFKNTNDGHRQSPLNRFKKFNSGFQK